MVLYGINVLNFTFTFSLLYCGLDQPFCFLVYVNLVILGCHVKGVYLMHLKLVFSIDVHCCDFNHGEVLTYDTIVQSVFYTLV